MNVRINGKPEKLTEDLTVTDLLVVRNVESPNMVSVEVNGAILKRSEFEETKVADGDVIEFLYFMGGGSR